MKTLLLTTRLAAMAVCGLAVHSASAQGATVWWQSAFGAGGSDLTWIDVAVSDDGTVAACATEQGTNSRSLLVQGWNPDGSVRFVYRFPDIGDDNDEKAAGIVNLGDRFMVLGSTDATTDAYDDALVVVMQSNGTVDQLAILDLNRGESVDEKPSDIDASGLDAYASVNSGSRAIVCKFIDGSIVWTGALTDATRDVSIEQIACGDELTYRGRLNASGDWIFGTIDSATGVETQRESSDASNKILDVGRNGLFVASRFSDGAVIAGRLHAPAGYSSLHVFDAAYYNEGEISQGLDGSVYVQTQDSLSQKVMLWKWDEATDAIVESYADNLGGPGREYVMSVDRFGNPIVMGTRERADGNVNARVWSWNDRLARQWECELTGTDVSDEFVQAFVIGPDLRVYGVGRSVHRTSSATKALIWRTRGFYKVKPDSVRVVFGRRTSGDLTSLQETDDVPYTVCRFIVPNQNTHPISIEFEATLPIGDVLPGQTVLTWFFTAKGNTPGILEGVSLYDWPTGAFGPESAFQLPISYSEMSKLPDSVSGAIRSTDRRVKARLRYKPFGPTATQLYCVSVDEVRWEAYPE